MAASSPCSTHLAISLHCAVPNGSRPRSLSSRHCAHAIQVPVRGSPGQYLSQCALPVVCWLLLAVRLVFEGGSSSSRCLQEGSLAWLRRCCEITATQDQASLCQGSRNTWRWGGGGVRRVPNTNSIPGRGTQTGRLTTRMAQESATWACNFFGDACLGSANAYANIARKAPCPHLPVEQNLEMSSLAGNRVPYCATLPQSSRRLPRLATLIRDRSQTRQR